MKTTTAACILFLMATRLSAAEPPAPTLNAAVERMTSAEAVDEAEASRRIAERRALAPVNAALVQEFGDRYAGRVITRDPLGMTVRLKGAGAGAVPGRIVATAMGPVQVRFVPGARHSSKDLQQIVASNRLRSYFPNAGGMGVNAAEGRIDIGVVDPDTFKAYRARQAEVEKALGVHLHFKRTAEVRL
ncbi:hypothetical protein [Stenotrophomonas sp. TWI1183]|uniref:hypothetical protein n=1 Tax=Stenotrophomonas sp. TWI1183 TaxID=3136799 RepID=UPI0032092F78